MCMHGITGSCLTFQGIIVEWDSMSFSIRSFCRPNEEKIVYFLLLSRKERQPSVEDEAKALAGASQGVCIHQQSLLV